ncbi:MAG: hypothetical protein ACPIOQ_49575, partial [Promethearchaeia archaeon]
HRYVSAPESEITLQGLGARKPVHRDCTTCLAAAHDALPVADGLTLEDHWRELPSATTLPAVVPIAQRRALRPNQVQGVGCICWHQHQGDRQAERPAARGRR